MVCEECQEQEATVHWAIVSWPSGEIIKHLCDACYPKLEAKQNTPPPQRPTMPPPQNVAEITAEEYLQYSARAGANAADKPTLRQIDQELTALPATTARLGLELLRMALQSLEEGDDPYELISHGGYFGNSSRLPKPLEYLETFEKIISLSVAKLAQAPIPIAPHPFEFGLGLAAIAMRAADAERFTKLLSTLRALAEKETPQHRQQVLERIQRTLAQVDSRRREKGHD